MREFIVVVRDPHGEELTRVLDAGVVPPVGSTVVNSDGTFIVSEVGIDFINNEINVYTDKYDLR